MITKKQIVSEFNKQKIYLGSKLTKLKNYSETDYKLRIGNQINCPKFEKAIEDYELEIDDLLNIHIKKTGILSNSYWFFGNIENNAFTLKIENPFSKLYFYDGIILNSKHNGPNSSIGYNDAFIRLLYSIYFFNDYKDDGNMMNMIIKKDDALYLSDDITINSLYFNLKTKKLKRFNNIRLQYTENKTEEQERMMTLIEEIVLKKI